jgi:hypothetical protein
MLLSQSSNSFFSSRADFGCEEPVIVVLLVLAALAELCRTELRPRWLSTPPPPPPLLLIPPLPRVGVTLRAGVVARRVGVTLRAGVVARRVGVLPLEPGVPPRPPPPPRKSLLTERRMAVRLAADTAAGDGERARSGRTGDGSRLRLRLVDRDTSFGLNVHPSCQPSIEEGINNQ